MTVTQPDIGVVARWAELRPADRSVVCDECCELVAGGVAHCGQCGQTVTALTGMLAAIIETAAGDRRLVISQRDSSGSWTAIRVARADDEAVRMIRRSANRRPPLDSAILEAAR